MHPRETSRPLGWILLGLAAAALIGHALVFNFVNDDAFISFRYADNLVRHGELVFNPGERVEGYTNFLWTLLMSGLIALGLDPVPWSKGLGIAFSVITLLAVGRFASRLEDRPHPAWDALPAFLLAAAPAFACWSTGGLETALFTCLSTLGWTRYLLEQQSTRLRPLSGVWFALAAATRPEGMLFFGLVGLHRLLTLVFVERRLPPRRDWLWGAGFALIFLPYFAWRWSYYGYVFPNTYYVKTGAQGFWGPGWRYFWSWVRDHFIWLLPVLAAVRRPLKGRREGRMTSLLLLLFVALSLHVVRVGGDFMALHRFMVPVMPALALLAALGLRTLASLLRADGQPPWRLRAGAVICAALLGVHVVEVDRAALAIGSEGGVDSIGWLSQFAGQCAAIGKHLAETADPDASLATTAAGTIPYYSRLYTLDILGLNDDWIAHNVPARGRRPGHTKSAPESYVLKKQIDYLVYHPSLGKRPPRQSRGRRRYWRDRGYEWETVKVPGLDPPWWGYWRRTQP